MQALLFPPTPCCGGYTSPDCSPPPHRTTPSSTWKALYTFAYLFSSFTLCPHYLKHNTHNSAQTIPKDRRMENHRWSGTRVQGRRADFMNYSTQFHSPSDV